MKTTNKHYQPFLMVLAVLIAVLGFSQFETEIKVMGYKTKPIAPLKDILLTEKAKAVPLPSIIVTKKIKAKDSTFVFLRQVDSSNIDDFENDSTIQLAHFFKALNELKSRKRKVRIAYFGDSMIEGDLITQDLREEMQDEFGGCGVGFVPVTSVVAGFRKSIVHSFDGWSTYNLINSPPTNHMLGISGYDFVPSVITTIDTTTANSYTWVKYNTVNKKHIDKFYQTKVLFGKSTGDNYVIVNGKNYKLTGSNTVNQLEINEPMPYQSINAKFQCKTPVDIFGFSMESDSGLIVDNFSFRGNSGMPITKVSQSVYSATNNCLNYDLIILGYGLNVVSPKVSDYSWYASGMTNVIKHMQASFPGVSILLISVGDRSFWEGSAYQTDASVPLLAKTQKKMAKDNGIAFWSLYDAMGGSGSMVSWVQGTPKLANNDYAHFNFQGAHKVGRLLYTKLMSEYSDYNKKQNQKLDL